MGVLVGKKAPALSLQAVVNGKIENEFSIEAYKGHYVVLFFYPLDFTYVCPTELRAFQEHLAAFEARNTKVVGCSVDSCFSHKAWLETPKEKGGIAGITYPLISDLNKEMSRAYDVLKEGDGIAYRGLFLIDKAGIVRHQVVNDLPLGRSIEEALRMVDALAFYETHGEVCPANWRVGNRAMKPNKQGLEEYFVQV